MTERRSRLAAPLAVAALLLSAGAFFAVDSHAEAQCLAQRDRES